jgi:hypothetical protein
LRLRLALIFAAVALLYAGPALLPGRVFFPADLLRDSLAWKRDPSVRVRVSNSILSDPVVQFEPWNAEVRRMVARGEMPWVNRFAGDGGPLFANPQTALFSPFNWPPLLLGMHGWVFAGLLKLFFAALGAYWLARELEVGRDEAIVSGLVFACCGLMIVWLLHPHTNVLALLPGFLAACLRLIRQPEQKHAALVIALAALLTAGGHPETLMAGVLSAIAFLLWHCERTHKWGGLGTMPALTGSLFGFLLMAVVTLPFALIAQSSYTALARPSVAHPFRLWTVVSQLVPGILGSPLRGELDLTALPQAEPFSIRAGAFIGAIVLLAIVVAWRELPHALRRGLKIGLVGLLISWCPPGIDRAFHNVPLIRLMALQVWATPFVLFASIAAGPALFILTSRPRRKLGVLLAIAGLAMLIAGVLPALPPMRPTLVSIAHDVIERLKATGHLQQATSVYEQRLTYYLAAAGATALRRIALPGLMWLIAGIALLRGKRKLVIGAALIELFAFGIGFIPSVPIGDVPPMPAAIAQIKKLDPDNRWLVAANFEVFPANIGTSYGVRDVVSYDVLTSKRRTEELIKAGYDPLLHTIPLQLSPDNVAALARLGVRFVINRDGSVTEIPDAFPQPLPTNARPDGIELGFVISLLAFGICIGWLRLYRSSFDTIPSWSSNVRS